ncbi:major histocompatibility complex class I-related gene protein-like isoform X1 [Pantherophis guttatus]|uniref:Major histocompatibility complex class I-related gene protein-like isoform X1 n=2 Tax=Pantherophis guttatus TaxID=94885 RepID=A0ABM3ZLZ9_PANGU|nr:major histocompatibility complex class I-related gene protein-like isoform X1 [Pantherophis guttatus]
MPLQRALLLYLWAVLASFVPGGRCGSSRHSLRYSYLKVSEPSQGLPQFLSVIYLDGQPIARYDILNRKMVSLVPWMEAVELKTPERMFRSDLEQLSNFNPQTGELHIWQGSVGCELWEDGSKGGFLQYSYNGMDFISFNKETLRWVAVQPQAQKVKEKWKNLRLSKRNKVFLEKTCMEWLQKYLSYQKEALKKTEPPVGKLTRKVVNDSPEVLICQAFGFYPKEIQATWRRDGEVCQNETLHRNVAPNSDGTYYVRLSIEIDPKERHRFRCHLEHEGLPEPLVLAWEEKTAIMTLGLVGAVIIVISAVLILFLIGCWLYYRKKLRQATTTHPEDIPLQKLCPSSPYGTEDEIRSTAMLPSKMTFEGCCGQNRQLREEEKTPLKASSDAYPDNMEEPAMETSECGPEEHLEDAEATKQGMEGLEEEGSPDPSEEQVDEHLAGEERGEMQLEGLTDPARSPGWRRIAAAADQEG